MTTDFSKPQRQSAVGVIIMAANNTQIVIRATIAPLIVALLKVETSNVVYWVAGFLLLFILVIFFSYLDYRKFTFYLNDERQEFIVNKGILNRTQLTIQLDKIQQVTINQNLLQKIVGIYGLKIDTAGSEGQEVNIKAIDRNVAESLQQHLLEGKKTVFSKDDDVPPIEATPFLKISILTLFKVGLTSNYGSSIALVTAFILATLQHSKEILDALSVDDGQVERIFEGILTLFSIAILVMLLLASLLVINMVRTFVRYFDFQISNHKLSLLISAGLFAKKNTLLSPRKVQIMTYSQNYFQKKMNLINVGLKQTEIGQQHHGQERHHANMEVPGCSAEERDQLLIMILGKIPETTAVFKPNFRFLNLPIFFRAMLPFAIFMLFWSFFPELSSYLPIALTYLVLAISMIYLSYRRHRLMVSQEFIIKKSGIWEIAYEIIRPHKIQAITTFQYPWHKNVNVGHVNIHTAAGMIQFKYGDYSEIKQLVNYWLYQIESSSEDWM